MPTLTAGSVAAHARRLLSAHWLTVSSEGPPPSYVDLDDGG